MPSARSRAGPSGKVVVSRDMPVGTIAAAPRPCRARPARKDAGSQAKVASSEAAPNRARPGEEQPAAAVQVADPAEEEQEAAGGQRERGDRPLQGGPAHAEVRAEDGQGDVQDGEVERDHELGGAQRRRGRVCRASTAGGVERAWGRWLSVVSIAMGKSLRGVGIAVGSGKLCWWWHHQAADEGDAFVAEDADRKSTERHRELREFLMSRRARVSPAEAGLPDGGARRRTPGLRREEVAVLAGVGRLLVPVAGAGAGHLRVPAGPGLGRPACCGSATPSGGICTSWPG